MRLVSFYGLEARPRTPRLGALVQGDADQGELVDVTAAARTLLEHEHLSATGAERVAAALVPPTLLGFVQAGPRGRDLAESAVAETLERGWEADPAGLPLRYPTAEVRHLPAIIGPPLLRDFMAFEKHLLNVFPRLGREIPQEWYNRPVYYKGNPASLGAHEQDIAIPGYADELDLEFEFAAVLGRGGTNIAEEDAADHIFGYTIYDDFSARAVQALEMTVGLGPAKGKDFVGAHVLGPAVVTADEIPDPYQLGMRAFVNGEQWTAGSSADMHWRFEQMIAYASRDERLQVGEVFGSGTVGDGSGAEQGRSLQAGDVVELVVEGLGTLRNRVIAAGRAESTAEQTGGSAR